MNFEPTAIPDVVLIRPRVFADSRGFFLETWEERKFARAGLDLKFVQDNHSRSKQYTLRGLHYQIKQPQGKLVRCIHGSVFDVVVDLRRSSPTFGRSVGITLTGDDHCELWVPPGFAHGFVVLSEQVDFLYKVTDFYAPEHERCVAWNDPDLNIEWPLPEGVEPFVSPKDAAGVAFRNAETFP